MTDVAIGQEPSPDAPDSGDTDPVGVTEFTTIGGYRLIQQLGEGGMGVVHLALDRSGRAVAIKVLRPHVAVDPAARTRLAREVETLSRIRHPNVAGIVDHDVVGERPFIVTRYIAGPPLDQVVESEGPLTGAALLELARGLAQALHAIHAAGVVHRDVKPGNVLLLDGSPVLIDFGIAHIADDERLTHTGLVMGTPGYLSPEIIEGADVTESTDWWGWAVTLGFAAAGRPPFGRGSMEAVLSRVVAGNANLRGVDPRLVPLLDAALSPYPEERPTDAEIIEALETYAAGGDVTDVLRTASSRAPLTAPIEAPPTAVLPPAEVPRRRDTPWSAEPGEPAVRAARPQTRVPDRIAPPPRRPEPTYRQPEPRAETESPTWAPPRATAGGEFSGADSSRGESSRGEPSGFRSAVGPAGGTLPSAPSGTGHPRTAPPSPPYAGTGQPGTGHPGTPLPPRPAMAGDPRIGRAARSGTLAALGALLVVTAAAYPALAVTIALIWSVVARTAERSVTASVLRRHSKGARSGDVARSVAAGPVHVVGGVISTAAASIMPAIVGAAGVFVSLFLLRNLATVSDATEYQVALATGMALTIFIAWFGPGGASLRRGSRSLARGIAPTATSAQVATGVFLVVALGLIGALALRTGLPIWTPWTEPPALFNTIDLRR